MKCYSIYDLNIDALLRLMQEVCPTPWMLEELGTFSNAAKNKSPIYGTFTVKKHKWKDKLLKVKTKIPELGMESPGVYCFWYLGDVDLTKHKRLHKVKGKKVRKSQKSNRAPMSKCGHWKEVDDHVEYSTVWRFCKQNYNGQQIFPLYVGKTSNLRWRINKHLDWPLYKKEDAKTQTIHDLVYDPNDCDDVKIKKPEGNTLVQFRKAFEFLFAEESQATRMEILRGQIGVTFIPTAVCDFQARFYGENLLIGHLRPPFNVDSER